MLYEPFSNLSLPVPNSNAILLPIVVHCIPQELLNILELMQSQGEILREMTLKKSSSYIGDHLETFKLNQKREKQILVYIYIN